MEDSSLLSSAVLASSRWFVDATALAEDTVATGIVLGLSPKQPDNSSQNSHVFHSLPVFALCSSVFLNFSSSFFPLVSTLFRSDP